MGRKRDGKHDSLVERLKQKPGLLGLDGNVILAMREPNLRYQDKYIVPDLVFVMSGGDLVVAECKSNGSVKNSDIRQVSCYREALRAYFSGDITTLLVYGNGKDDTIHVEKIE